MSWLTVHGNHNSVDLAGVTGAAMANIPSRDRRAFFAAAAEKYVQNYLLGFTPDGYCSEGVGYWNYGFGRFVMLAETLKQASGGAVDMMQAANVRQIALFGRRMEILPGIYPSFADCDPTEQPDAQIMAFLSRRYGWGMRDVEAKGLGPAVYSSGFTLGVFGFPNSATATGEATVAATSPPRRDWFSDAGVLICRPAPGKQHALGVAMKGGHNAEQHNHNDVGSFIVALGRSTPVVDPGAEIYTGRTFSVAPLRQQCVEFVRPLRAARGWPPARNRQTGRCPRRKDRIHRHNRHAGARPVGGLQGEGTEDGWNARFSSRATEQASSR